MRRKRMKRSGLIGLALLVALLLAACGNAAAPAATHTPTEEPTATVEDTPTVPAPTGTKAELTETPTSQPQAADPTATSEANDGAAASDGEGEDFLAFLQVQPDDWVRGPDDAEVTIVEYADYQ
jgi:ABC-type glycerol-3-phosphate transport system substrate-binding protein